MIVLDKLVLWYYIYKQRSRYKKIQEERKMGRKMERKKRPITKPHQTKIRTSDEDIKKIELA